MNKVIAFTGLLIATVTAHHLFDDTADVTASNRFHSDFEIDYFSSAGLTTDSAFMFSGSGVCVECHGRDPQGQASVTQEGIDINVVDDWRSTMMANSAKDPLWRAKVSHEVLVNPAHQEALETKCTSCHAPMGHFEALHAGQTTYSIAEMLTDSLALDGVSCLACHKQLPDSMGLNFSGELVYDTLKNAYGQYQSPLAGPMIALTGYWPVHSDKMSTSEACAGCHTLITNTVDLDGNSTGGEFVEQATYHEWLNSIYNDSVSCQNCHMPNYPGLVRLIAGYEGIPPRSNFSMHHFSGANAFMLKLMKEHRVELGIDATAQQYDSTIARTMVLLTEQSVDMSASIDQVLSDTVYVDIELVNKAGHKFPSGYPSRRAVLEVVLTDAVGDTIFQSGTLNSNYEAFGQDPTYEPHYNMINNEDDVQMYEIVMGDVNGDVTTVLERADHPIKDNRLVPVGFTTSHASYDTTEMAGLVLSDMDFNNNGGEGSGSDRIEYRIPLNGYSGAFSVSVRFLYQTLPPKWNDEMFSYNSAEIDTFRNMYFSADREPVVVADTVMQNGLESTTELNSSELTVYPNPTSDRLTISDNDELGLITIMDLKGRVLHREQTTQRSLVLDVSNFDQGVYLISSEGQGQAHRFIVQ